MITIYGIKTCDTVRKALRWLDNNHREYIYHDFRSDGLEQQKLQGWLNKLGWEKLLNTRSTSWRQLALEQRQTISAETAFILMLENPTLIKRPVLETQAKLLVGFLEAEYQQL